MKRLFTKEVKTTNLYWDSSKIKIGDKFLISNLRIDGSFGKTECEVVDVDCYEVTLVYHLNGNKDVHRLLFLDPGDEQYLS